MTQQSTETPIQAAPMTHSGKAVVSTPSQTDILITREFAAPPALVYRAWTTADLIKRWWAGNRGVITSVEYDLRVGGRWRIAMAAHPEDGGGFEVAFHGEIRTIVPNEQLVCTEVFEAVPTEESLVTTTFTPVGTDRTLMTQLCSYSSVEVRDMVIASGMEGGMQESMDQLEQVAASLAS